MPPDPLLEDASLHGGGGVQQERDAAPARIGPYGLAFERSIRHAPAFYQR
jgi:hypothetical protein